MARLARVVVPGLPHHVTQRGNGRSRTFFCDEDYAFYRDLLAASCRAADVEIWAWVLMPNHVHLILVPKDADGLRRALAPLHRRYAGHIHARRKRSGHFWQGRFGAVAMDEEHLAAALRYVALNPVRARLVERAQDWPWSSAGAHLRQRDDKVTSLAPVLDRFPRFADVLETERGPELYERLRQAESVGRPLGDDAFLERLERLTHRLLKPAKRGPKPTKAASEPGRQLNALSPWRDDKVTSLAPVLDRFPRFADVLETERGPELYERLRQAESVGRPLGDDAFLERLERLTHRLLKPAKRGPKPTKAASEPGRQLNALSP